MSSSIFTQNLIAPSVCDVISETFISWHYLRLYPNQSVIFYWPCVNTVFYLSFIITFIWHSSFVRLELDSQKPRLDSLRRSIDLIFYFCPNVTLNVCCLAQGACPCQSGLTTGGTPSFMSSSTNEHAFLAHISS